MLVDRQLAELDSCSPQASPGTPVDVVVTGQSHELGGARGLRGRLGAPDSRPDIPDEPAQL